MATIQPRPVGSALFVLFPRKRLSDRYPIVAIPQSTMKTKS
jgi:hypothetical protein